jgi:hypothetical protein
MRERGRAWVYTLLLMPLLFVGGFVGSEAYAVLTHASPSLMRDAAQPHAPRGAGADGRFPQRARRSGSALLRQAARHR